MGDTPRSAHRSAVVAIVLQAVLKVSKRALTHPSLVALAVASFTVLSYVAHQAVIVYGWLAPGEMVRGLALAETTPGR